jgi:hypothetical protein
MLGIFVDLENELTDIEREVNLLARAIEIYKRDNATAEPAWNWLVIQGITSAIEKIYSGCERVMSMIASEIDGAKIDRSDGWHVSLLKRMANAFPDVRHAVISDETYGSLDRLRAFRHRARNSYGPSLNAEIVLERAEETQAAFERLRSDIAAFAIRMHAHNR